MSARPSSQLRYDKPDQAGGARLGGGVASCASRRGGAEAMRQKPLFVLLQRGISALSIDSPSPSTSLLSSAASTK